MSTARPRKRRWYRHPTPNYCEPIIPLHSNNNNSNAYIRLMYGVAVVLVSGTMLGGVCWPDDAHATSMLAPVPSHPPTLRSAFSIFNQSNTTVHDDDNNMDLRNITNIMFVHVGKAGGETLKQILRVGCQVRGNRRLRHTCLDRLPSSELSHRVTSYHHCFATFPTGTAQRDASAYLFNLRHPVDRLWSWYHYVHPRSCPVYPQRLDPEQSRLFPTSVPCRTYRDMLRNTTGPVATFFDCFPTLESWTMALLSHPPHYNTTTTTCTDWAQRVVTGGTHLNEHDGNSLDAFAHVRANLRHYYAHTVRRPFAHQPVLVVRTATLWSDVTQLEHQLRGDGGNGNQSTIFGSWVGSRRNQSVRPRNVRQSDMTHAFCCAMREELAIYIALLQRALNLSAPQKMITVLAAYQQCGATNALELNGRCELLLPQGRVVSHVQVVAPATVDGTHHEESNDDDNNAVILTLPSTPHNVTVQRAFDSSCPTTAQVQIAAARSSQPWTLQALDAKGQPKRMGGDEFYVTYARGVTMAVAIMLDHVNGTYTMDFVQTPLSAVVATEVAATTAMARSMAAGDDDDDDMTLTVALQYTCGEGALAPPAKITWQNGGGIMHYDGQEWTMTASVPTPRIRTMKVPTLPANLSLSNFRQVIAFGDSTMEHFVGHAQKWYKPNIYYGGNVGMVLNTTTLSSWQAKLKKRHHHEFVQPSTALLIGSATWDLLTNHVDADFVSHMQSCRDLIVWLRTTYPHLVIVWKSPTALHPHRLSWHCPQQDACTSRTRYMSASRARDLHGRQRALMQTLQVPYFDIYHATYLSADASQPNDGRHYQPALNQLMLSWLYR